MGGGARIVVMMAGLALWASAAAAHESRAIESGQRVFSRSQTLGRSSARVQLRVRNERPVDVRLVCETVVRGKWRHATTGELRSYSEDWFLTIRRLPAGATARSKKGTISVAHPELTSDPAWEPRGVAVRTPHCHAPAR